MLDDEQDVGVDPIQGLALRFPEEEPYSDEHPSNPDLGAALIWTVVVRPDPDLPAIAKGFVRANRESEAIELAGGRFIEARCTGEPWPDDITTALVWHSGW